MKTALTKHQPAAALPAGQSDDAIKSAVAKALACGNAAKAAIHTAIEQALLAGQMLAEKKAALEAAGYGQFSKWIEANFPEVTRRTVYTWISLADTVRGAVGVGTATSGLLLTAGGEMPVSEVLTAELDDLPEEAREARQMMFDFCEGKSIRRALEEAAIHGEDVRMKRAVNGATQGGTHAADNRKDFAKFIALHLSDISTHLEGWKKFKAGQAEAVQQSFAGAVEKWPTPLLETLRDAIKETLKTR